MANYNKYDLMEMSDAEIVTIASEFGIKVTSKSTKENIIFEILEAQAIKGAENSKKPKRTRKTKEEKAEQPSEVETKKTEDATTETPKVESTETKKKRSTTKKEAKTDTVETTTETTAPKRKTKNSKKEVEQEEPTNAKSEEKAPIPAIAEEETEKETPSKKEVEKHEVANDKKKYKTDFIIVKDIPMINNEYEEFVMPTEKKEQKISTDKSPQVTYDFSDLLVGSGVLEINPDNSAFLRSSDYNYLPSPDDIAVPMTLIKTYCLNTGDVVEGNIRIPRENEKYFTLTHIKSVNGRSPKEMLDRVAFEHLTPLFPEEKFELCADPKTHNISVRLVDLFTPIGKGQRALIVAQPKTGKTILMKNIANAIAANNPNTYLMMLLIDERPEEVTDMARTVNAEVIASTFDEPASQHVKIANLVLEKAKRMVECGHDVVIFLDSITRLARAYNTVAPASGKILTGGVDSNALQKPKRFFGAARNIEGGGSLTIIATALIDTGSKMDEVIFEEFKGTGNMELQLDRSLSNKRIFPSINCVASSTRRDDLLQDKYTRDRMWVLRKVIAEMKPLEAIDRVMEAMENTENNAEFLVKMNS